MIILIQIQKLNQNGSESILSELMLRLIVAFTPLVGAIVFPLLIPTTIEHLGLGSGVLSALILSTLWFVAMLRTSEMPH